jgi:hypothetical protein
MGARGGVSKGVQDCRRPPALRRTTPEKTVKPVKSGPPAVRIRLGHGGPGWYFRETMATPCHKPMASLKTSHSCQQPTCCATLT